MISCRLNLKGTNTTVASGCNSGLDAAFLAFNAVRLGDADIMVIGASEAPITPYIHAAFCATGFLSRENSEPKKALKPYDIHADGAVMGEGGAVLIMEELDHALRRKAKIYGEVLSYSSLNEAFDFVEVDADCETMARNFQQALKNAKLDTRDIDYINAHGNGMLSYDINETNAIKQAFGEIVYNIPVTSIKPITGQSFSATGIFQIIATLLVIKEKVIPPTMNLNDPAPECDLNYVPNSSIKREIRTALINTHGFGGRLTAFIVGKYPDTRVPH
jgi:3-oxoacyl-(acyl-carrier-protein) synthase